MSDSIEAEYARRRAALRGEFDRSSARGSTLTWMLLGALAVLVYLGYRRSYMAGRRGGWWCRRE